MKSKAAAHRRNWRHDLRMFAAGAGCGLLAGVLLVAALLLRYDALTWPGRLADMRGEDVRTPVLEPVAVARPTGTIGRPESSAALEPKAPPGATNPRPLKGRDLLIPVEGVKPEQLTPQFDEPRGGSRRHEAIDILAPRGTPVRAVDDGTIARLFVSKQGGNTIYQFDPTATFCYYYAHLDRYAEGLTEGAPVRKGQVIGYVGTSGNAPKNTPHLHFAIFRLTDAKHWWEGTPIDPYDVWR
jgi:murein DD-endopeptidase MepM/ murein hydrolase activator NlpD